MKAETETVSKMSEIIEIQQEAINELFSLLAMHLTVEEAKNLPVIKNINKAARMQAEL